MVDNHEGRGIPINELDAGGTKTSRILGHSENCSIPTRVDYFYRTHDGAFKPLPDPSLRPADIARTTLGDGRQVDYVVRLERGTINRFIHGIAMLAPADRAGIGPLERPDTGAWNRKLIYAFQGGVGLGHWQGEAKLKDMLMDAGLSQGYAIAYSTGNVTGTHYNLVLAAETALMLKAHFRILYGKPDYTVGVGGSGGAIQQYIFGQNFPGLIDAAIPQQSYSDMVTQTTYALDCQLLEYYFDVSARANPRWPIWSQRSLVEGLAASDSFINTWTQRPGSSECVQAWRTLTTSMLNPRWVHPLYFQALTAYQFPPEVIASIKGTHWNDLQNIYGVDDQGYAPITWDNVGVQYGLRALVAGDLSKDEFLDLNARIGGWKSQRDMVLVNFPWKADASSLTYDPWDSVNINLEPALDMHHIQQSFATRSRMVQRQVHADNQIIWIGAPPHNPAAEALAVVDEWMRNLRRSPEVGVAANKPAGAVDKCFDPSGRTIAAGNHVWNGILDQQAPGVCAQTFRPYSTSRIVAGGAIAGDIFKCQTMSLDQAITQGVYGQASFTPQERALATDLPERGMRLPPAGRGLAEVFEVFFKVAIP